MTNSLNASASLSFRTFLKLSIISMQILITFIAWAPYGISMRSMRCNNPRGMLGEHEKSL